MNARLKLASFVALTCLILSSLLWFEPLGVQPALAATTASYGGFLYPWSGTKYLIQNVHPAGANAIDVTSSNTSYTEFDILSPKDGVVVDFEDRFPRTQNVSGCPSNYKDFTNYVLLGHGPLNNNKYQTYTLYYHLKQGSVSGSGISKNAFVRLGQKIGTAGDTGAWNNIIHLHMEMSTNPQQSSKRSLNCNGVNLSNTYYYVFSPGDSIPIGFEEFENRWPLLNGNQGNLTSYNWNGIQANDCNPTSSNVVLYNHIDYGGECVKVQNPENGYDVPSGLHISSIYLNPSWVVIPYRYHTLTLWDGFGQTGTYKVISNSAPKLLSFGWNDRVKSVHNAEHLNVPWLVEESYAFQAPFDVNVHIKVAVDQDLVAWRVCFDGQNCQENASPANEIYYTWNTYGWADGNHTISVQYRRTSDNGNWATADYYETNFYLSPNRQTYAPCSSNVDGARLVSGSDCVIVTTNVADMAPVGWADRSNLSITAQGYDILAYNSVDFQGEPYLIRDGQTTSVGGNISSVEVRSPLPDPYVPLVPLGIDGSTIVYLPMDEGSGSNVYSQVGSLTGTLAGSASFTSGGRFGSAISQSSTLGGLNFGAQSFGSPLTVEMFVKFNSTSGDQRLAGQLGGGPNTGSNKWLVGTANNRFRIWACYANGCHEGFSLENLQANRWYYLMFTYNGGTTAKLYVDSVLHTTVNMGGSMPSGATTFEIGKGENIYGCNCTLDDFRISNIVRVPTGPVQTTMNLDTQISNPVSKEVTASINWSGAAYQWHTIDWGDSSDYDMQGYSGNSAPTHNYASAGTYTVTFTVLGADNLPHVLSEQVTVQNYECGEAVTLPGVSLYDYEVCASGTQADMVQFTEPGLYNLTDYGLDNKATSLHVPQDGSMSVRLYEGANGTGQSMCVSWDMWYMPLDSWPNQTTLNDSISSVEVFDTIGCTPPPTASMSHVFLDPHGQIQLDFSWSGALTDSWQTVYWGDGTEWSVHGGASGSDALPHWYNSPGTYTVTLRVVNAAPDYGTYDFTQEVTVGYFECGGAVTQSGVVLYKHSTCAYSVPTEYQEFTTPGTYNLTGLNDQATSLHVPSGMSVRIYKDANQSGDSMCVSWDMWDMAVDSWPLGGTLNDSVTSLQVFNNTTCTP